VGAFVPIHPPEAEQPTVSVLVHEMTLVPPTATFDGDAFIVTVGVATAMRTVFEVEAGVSVHVTEYVVSAEIGPQLSLPAPVTYRFSSVT
jgi:hypothetical protein